MKITVGSRWTVKDGNGTAPVIVKEVKGSKVHYLYEGGSGFAHIVTVMDFIEFFEPEPDTGNDIVVGFDNVNNPQHYTNGQVECIDAIRAALTDEEFRGFCKGNVLKYTWREKHKGGNESLEKAAWYLKQMVGDGEKK